jgi:hypothetical protein
MTTLARRPQLHRFRHSKQACDKGNRKFDPKPSVEATGAGVVRQRVDGSVTFSGEAIRSRILIAAHHGDGDVSAFVHRAEIAGMQPACFIDRFPGLCLPAPVAAHDHITAEANLPLRTAWNRPPLGIDEFDFHVRPFTPKSIKHAVSPFTPKPVSGCIEPCGQLCTTIGNNVSPLGEPIFRARSETLSPYPS